MSTLHLDSQTMYQRLLMRKPVVSSSGALSVSIKFEVEVVLIGSTVFSDGDYIPPSVRYAVTEKHYLFNAYLPCRIHIDEDNAAVELMYQGTKPTSADELQEVVEDFTLAAEKWYTYLLKEARKDLMYVLA